MDKSIEIELIQNKIDVQLIKVETISSFISPAQPIIEKKEVE